MTESVIEQADVGKPERKERARSVAINRNFCNYPFARDVRSSKRLRWRKSKPNGRNWLAELPGERDMSLELPADVEDRFKRAPTPFDVAALLTVLREAQVSKSRTVTFKSRSALVQAMGFSAEDANLARLDDALDYWSLLRIRWHGIWYERGERRDHTLPTPFQRLEDDGRRVRLRVSDEWLPNTRTGYFVEVPLPLPRDAAAQNLVLLLMTSDLDPGGDREAMKKPLYPRYAPRLCRKVGLAHTNRNRVLRRALDRAMDWYYERGGAFLYRWEEGTSSIRLGVMEPVRIDRAWRQASKAEAEEAVRKRSLSKTVWVKEMKYADGQYGQVWELLDGTTVDDPPPGFACVHSEMPDEIREQHQRPRRKRA